MTTEYFVFDQRLPAYRTDNGIPMLGYGSVAQKYEPYMDLARWDENVQPISKKQFDAMDERLRKDRP